MSKKFQPNKTQSLTNISFSIDQSFDADNLNIQPLTFHKIRSKSFDFCNEYEEKSIEMEENIEKYSDDTPSQEINEGNDLSMKYLKTYGGKSASREWKSIPSVNSLIHEAPIKISENIKKIKRDMSQETAELILNCLKSHSIFGNMSETHMFQTPLYNFN